MLVYRLLSVCLATHYYVCLVLSCHLRSNAPPLQPSPLALYLSHLACLSVVRAVHLSNVAVQQNYVNGKRDPKLPDNNFMTSDTFVKHLE